WPEVRRRRAGRPLTVPARGARRRRSTVKHGVDVSESGYLSLSGGRISTSVPSLPGPMASVVIGATSAVAAAGAEDVCALRPGRPRRRRGTAAFGAAALRPPAFRAAALRPPALRAPPLRAGALAAALFAVF